MKIFLFLVGFSFFSVSTLAKDLSIVYYPKDGSLENDYFILLNKKDYFPLCSEDEKKDFKDMFELARDVVLVSKEKMERDYQGHLPFSRFGDNLDAPVDFDHDANMLLELKEGVVYKIPDKCRIFNKAFKRKERERQFLLTEGRNKISNLDKKAIIEFSCEKGGMKRSPKKHSGFDLYETDELQIILQFPPNIMGERPSVIFDEINGQMTYDLEDIELINKTKKRIKEIFKIEGDAQRLSNQEASVLMEKERHLFLPFIIGEDIDTEKAIFKRLKTKFNEDELLIESEGRVYSFAYCQDYIKRIGSIDESQTFTEDEINNREIIKFNCERHSNDVKVIQLKTRETLKDAHFYKRRKSRDVKKLLILINGEVNIDERIDINFDRFPYVEIRGATVESKLVNPLFFLRNGVNFTLRNIELKLDQPREHALFTLDTRKNETLNFDNIKIRSTEDIFEGELIRSTRCQVNISGSNIDFNGTCVKTTNSSINIINSRIKTVRHCIEGGGNQISLRGTEFESVSPFKLRSGMLDFHYSTCHSGAENEEIRNGTCFDLEGATDVILDRVLVEGYDRVFDFSPYTSDDLPSVKIKNVTSSYEHYNSAFSSGQCQLRKE